MKQGDFEIVISDYNRAKALFHNSEVKSFKKGKQSEVEPNARTNIEGHLVGIMIQGIVREVGSFFVALYFQPDASYPYTAGWRKNG